MFLLLSALTLLAFVLNLWIGSVRIPPDRCLSIFLGEARGTMEEGVLLKIRLPRALSALLLGGALALSGFLLQTWFENPIAGPYVLGISSGAKLLVAFTLILLLPKLGRVSSLVLVGAAFLGAMISTGFLLVMAGKMRRTATLLVAGIMVGYLCSALSDLLITFADEADIVSLHGWSRGSFSGMTMGDAATAALILAAVLVPLLFLSKPISALRLGEEYAKTMGVNIRGTRMAVILLSSILSATVTAFAGPVSFVGIAVPVLVRKLFGTSEPGTVIPGCLLGGAFFCLFCDLLARTLFAPTELNISTVTALFGAPVVIRALFGRHRTDH